MKSRIITLFIFLFYVSASNAAITFDGVDDYVSIGDKTQLKITGEITISVWVKGNAQQNKGIVSKYSATSAQRGYLLASENVANSQKITWYYQRSAGSFNADDTLTTSTNVLDGTWHHIVATFLPSTYARIYVDGILNASDTTTIQSAIVNNTAPVQIGLHDTSTNFNGSIDDLRIYNRALTETEIAILAKSPKRVGGAVADSSLVGHWEMEDNEIGHVAGRAQDETVNANHGSFTNFANLTTAFTSDTSPKSFSPNQSLIFDGVNDFVNVPASTSLVANTGSFSVWFKAASSQFTNARIVEIGNTTNRIGIFINAGKLYLYPLRSGAGFWNVPTSENFNDNLWHHAVGTWSSTNAYLYIDGALKLTFTGNALLTLPSPSPLFIGQYVGGGSYYFKGRIDDVRIYDDVLTPAEITYLFSGGTSGTDPGTANLKGYWKLDDSTVQDSTGNNNHGIGLGAPFYSGNAINRN
jgi:Concanavalin A-like lectin/glucanases superfamily